MLIFVLILFPSFVAYLALTSTVSSTSTNSLMTALHSPNAHTDRRFLRHRSCVRKVLR